ncbi:MAG: hypothetical protein C5B59_01725 [Bacteroidetes bacterium]|nr:MAG: hypothetical protein C5B59_01725 [Bacteroidota bacterium]
MNWLNWKELIPENIAQAFCRTIFHSLWEGALLAIAGGIVILLTRKFSSSIRYNLLTILFFLFIITVSFTFYRELDSGSSYAFIATFQSSNYFSPVGTHSAVISDKTLKVMEVISNYLNTHAFMVTAIWLVVFSFRFFSLLANIGTSYRIRKRGIYFPDQLWQKKINQLSRHLGISQQVQLLESKLARVPVVVGFFKPVILFPFSLLSNLPVQQVEAVLLHELAHIKRRDLFVNLLQHLAEIVFFFNPAVIWISSQIRNERENCCDDIALAQLHNKTPFIRALVAFQEFNLDKASYAVGFPGKSNHLLNRVLRIVNNNNKTLTNMEKILLATGLVAVGLVTITFTQAENAKSKLFAPSAIGQNIQQSPAIPPPPVKTDSVPEANNKSKTVQKTSFLFSKDGKSYRGRRIDGKVTELYVDGQKIPDSKLGDFQKIFEDIDLDMKQKARDVAEKQEDLKVQNEAMAAERLALKNQIEAAARANVEVQTQQAEQYAKQAKEYIKAVSELKSRQDDLVKIQQEIQVAQVKEYLSRIQSQSPIIVNGITYVPEAKLAPPVPPTVVALPSVSNNDPISSIIRDLKMAGIIADDVTISFTLNSSKLIVNGTTQSSSVHKKFADKYIHGSKDHIIYSASRNSVRSDVYIQ